ncbi:RNA-binding domain-containing protein [Niabella sp. CJ426]|uniref:RNA-binding domain-containing protein n=1 Tax=Niabella sp. CJ426 TaxID=3393740 RepID=UPI003CFFD302
MMKVEELNNLVKELISQPREAEWIEFKHNFHSLEEVGERLSALSNGACLQNQHYGFLIFGIEDESHQIIGTDFRPSRYKKGNEESENWIAQRLSPRVDFMIYEFDFDGKSLTLFQIDAASTQPVDFYHEAYIRIGSITRKLKDFPEKERKIWKKFGQSIFEKDIAKTGLTSDDVVKLLDTSGYFEMIELPYPTSQAGVLERFESENLIKRSSNGWTITNLGAILFAKDIKNFPTVSRKAVRVVVYDGKNKVHTKKDITGVKGYAVGFEQMLQYINDQLPTSEVITQALRKIAKAYPEIALRELIANALIHQDFAATGIGPFVEIFDDRIEISNPGQPLISPLRFIDEYQSRNEFLASLMRRLRICEEKGSGIDKVIYYAETGLLPAPDFRVKQTHTTVVLFSHQKLNDMSKADKIRACYQHCCLKYVSNETMTNESLRERFQIEDQNAAIASRIIKETLTEGLIKPLDPENRSRKYPKYVPNWA